MSLTIARNSRGPILALSLPTSVEPVSIRLENVTTSKSLALNLPAAWSGDDLDLDFFRRTIVDQDGVDRSALLDPVDNQLWAPNPLITGSNELTIEAFSVDGPVLVEDGFDQSSGNLTGKAAPSSAGTYAALITGTTDFTVNGSGRMSRASGYSPSSNALRAVGLAFGGALDDLRASLDFDYSDGTLPGGTIQSSILARAASSNTYLDLRLDTSLNFLVYSQLSVYKVVSGTSTLLDQTDQLDRMEDGNLKLEVLGNEFEAFLDGVSVLSGSDSTLAAGQALGSGGVYIGDAYSAGGGGGSYVNRRYDNFFVQSVEPVTYGATATLSWEVGHFG